MIHRSILPVILAAITLSADANAQDTLRMTREMQDAAFLADACEPPPVDTTLWPRHKIADVTVAVPPQYRLSQRIPNTLLFRSAFASIRISRVVNAKYGVMGPRRGTTRPLAQETWCEPGNYGGYNSIAHAYIYQGQYNFSIKWEPFDGDDQSEWVAAYFSTSRYEEAVKLRSALATIRHIKDDPAVKASGGNPSSWFYNPCLGDSVDTWGWTRYDLRGVRIWAPREIRQVKTSTGDELNLSVGKATLRLRLHNDSTKVFAGLNLPQSSRNSCDASISDHPANAFSFRPTANTFGLAVRWPDADSGDWLEAVIQSSNLDDAAKLRRTLFTITFTGKPR